jgi:hypothetical protein
MLNREKYKSIIKFSRKIITPYSNSLKIGDPVNKVREVISQKTATLTVTAVRTSDLAINFILIFSIW